MYENNVSSFCILQAYMFFGLYSQPLEVPDCLYPSPLTKHELPVLGKMSEAPTPMDNNTDRDGKERLLPN